ncbi:MAG: ATP-dependent Clp protease adaptor ClpS [Planctomycetota bacterium]|nr:MAG: ATP-dependent Clp protease adaptor ClpS [Planctomycetota bacterium]
MNRFGPSTLPQAAVAEPALMPDQDQRQQVMHLPRWHIILLDDDDHSYEYVIEMVMQLFGHSLERAFQMAVEVDSEGRVIVDTTTRERALLKQEQIHAYGPDPLIPRCRGSMTAVLEPADA